MLRNRMLLSMGFALLTIVHVQASGTEVTGPPTRDMTRDADNPTSAPASTKPNREPDPKRESAQPKASPTSATHSTPDPDKKINYTQWAINNLHPLPQTQVKWGARFFPETSEKPKPFDKELQRGLRELPSEISNPEEYLGIGILRSIIPQFVGDRIGFIPHLMKCYESGYDVKTAETGETMLRNFNVKAWLLELNYDTDRRVLRCVKMNKSVMRTICPRELRCVLVKTLRTVWEDSNKSVKLTLKWEWSYVAKRGEYSLSVKLCEFWHTKYGITYPQKFAFPGGFLHEQLVARCNIGDVNKDHDPTETLNAYLSTQLTEILSLKAAQ